MGFDATKVGSFRKSDKVEIVFQVINNRDTLYLDFREMVLKEEAFTPTYKGLTVRKDIFPNIKEALQEMKEEGSSQKGFTQKEVALKQNKIILKEQSFKGRRFIDIRQYYPDDEGEFKPTKKGITIPIDKFIGFVEEVEKLGM